VSLLGNIAIGLKALRFSGQGGQSGYGPSLYGISLSELGLDGAGIDTARQAGPLWLSGPVLACVKWLARTHPEAPQTVLRRTGGQWEPVPDHPALALLENPGPRTDSSVLLAATLLSWVIDGNVYWYKVRSLAGKVVGLRYLPHFIVEPRWPADGSVEVSHFDVRIDSRTYQEPPENIVHLRDGSDPYNDRKGLSELAAVMKEICGDHGSVSYSAAILRNFGVPGVLLQPKVPPDKIVSLAEPQRKALLDLWRDRVSGENRGMPLVPSMPLEVMPIGLSPNDLAIDKLTQLFAPRIFAAIGIDPMVVGYPSHTRTYSNYQESREAAYESNVIPTQRSLDSQVTRQLMPDIVGALPGDRFGRDYSHVRVLQQDADKLHQRLTAAVGGPWITPNNARMQVGLDDLAGGDVLYPPKGGGGAAANEEQEEPSRNGREAARA
jgi:HK97 family phage portal protein